MRIDINNCYYETDNKTFYDEAGQVLLTVNDRNEKLIAENIKTRIKKLVAFYSTFQRMFDNDNNKVWTPLKDINTYIFYKLKNLNDKGTAGTAFRMYVKNNHIQKRIIKGQTCYYLPCFMQNKSMLKR